MRILVIGGGAAGPAAASQARRRAPDAEISIFEKGSLISYGACEEPYYIADVIKDYRNLLARTPEEFKAKQNIEVKTGHRVEEIRPAEKKIVVRPQGGEAFMAAYDRLIYCAGARSRRLGLPGEDLPGVFFLKELTDAIAIKEFIRTQAPMEVVTIGAGFIALEMAETFHNLKIKNTIIELAPAAGGRLEPEISARIAAEFASRGIAFYPDTKPQAITRQPGGGLAVDTSRGSFAADLVLISVGVQPNNELAQAAGIAVGAGGAIRVDARQATNVPDIFAAGDGVEARHRVGGHQVSYSMGDVANKQGWVAGENAAGGNMVFPGVLGSGAVKFFDWEIAMTGLAPLDAEHLGFACFSYRSESPSRVPVMPGSRPIYIKLCAEKKTGRLLGAQMIGKDGVALRINTLACALQQQMTLAQIVDLDLAYSPPFSPVIDPILRAANGAMRLV